MTEGVNQVLTMIPNSEVGTARGRLAGATLPKADLRQADSMFQTLNFEL